MEHPFLDVKILKNKSYAISVISSMLLYFVMMGSSVMMPLYVQTVMGYSALISGLVTLPGSLATALVSPFAGRMYDNMGIKKIFVVGSICLVVSNFGMSLISMSTPLIVAVILNVIRNISIGALMMPLLTWGVSNVELKKVADASSLLTSFRTISGSIGSAVFVGIMTTVGASSAIKYGDGALMHGLNISFGCMGLCTLVLLAIAIFAIPRKKEA
jgi:Na+/melibiose symporter-like transporter